MELSRPRMTGAAIGAAGQQGRGEGELAALSSLGSGRTMLMIVGGGNSTMLRATQTRKGRAVDGQHTGGKSLALVGPPIQLTG